MRACAAGKNWHYPSFLPYVLAPSAASIPLWERPSKRGGRDPLIMCGGGGCRIHSELQSGTNTREKERIFTCGEAD